LFAYNNNLLDLCSLLSSLSQILRFNINLSAMVVAEDKLSRAISSLDLNAALTATQNKPKTDRYSQEELLSLRPRETNTKELAERIKVGNTEADGIITPPSQISPNPPPPTPDVADGSASSISIEQDRTIKDEEDGVKNAEGEPDKKTKKKRKKSRSGKVKKIVTGFEGLSPLGSTDAEANRNPRILCRSSNHPRRIRRGM